MKLLKKLKNDNRGDFSYLEVGFTYVVLFFVGTFILDLILLAATMLTLNHQVTYLANKLSFQGGFIGTSSDVRHWSNQEIYNYLKSGMSKVGINGINNQWGLDYKPNIDGSWMTIIDSSKSPAYDRNYKSSSIGSKGIATNFHQSSSIRLWFDYEYKFSGKIFNFTNVLTRLHLDVDFVNEYID